MRHFFNLIVNIFLILQEHIWATPCQNVSLGFCQQRKPRSACTFAQSDQGLCCPLTDSLDTTECFSGEQMPTWDFKHMQDYVNLGILHMLKGTFLLDQGFPSGFKNGGPRDSLMWSLLFQRVIFKALIIYYSRRNFEAFCCCFTIIFRENKA